MYGMKYNFFAVELVKNETSFYTYDMFCKKYNINRAFFKRGLEELNDSGFINFAECETENYELYAAILIQDYAKINLILSK